MQHPPLLTETWLIIDDDEVFCRILKKSLEKQGNQVLTASNADSALQLAKKQLPKFIILDLNIGDDNGIHLIEPLLAITPTAKILMLTGYASIATAVSAVKMGAYHYLPKPCSLDDIYKVLDIVAAPTKSIGSATDERLSLEHHEWEYIHQVLDECQGNISEAARVLKCTGAHYSANFKKRKVDAHNLF
ncbi:MAG: response regulator [Moraxella sp.]